MYYWPAPSLKEYGHLEFILINGEMINSPGQTLLLFIMVSDLVVFFLLKLFNFGLSRLLRKMLETVKELLSYNMRISI